MPKRPATPEERAEIFWSKVIKTDGCWFWTGAKVNGYGRFFVGRQNGAVVLAQAHVWAWEQHNGRRMAPGMRGCHTCDTPSCVRPDHIFEGTQDDNLKDMWAKGRGKGGGAIGQDNGRAKITPVQIQQIREAYVPYKVSARMLAEQYGVHTSTINRIVRGLSWEHL